LAAATRLPAFLHPGAQRFASLLPPQCSECSRTVTSLPGAARWLGELLAGLAAAAWFVTEPQARPAVVGSVAEQL